MAAGLMLSPPRWLRLLALAGVVLTSASCFVALKAGLEQAPPLRLVALRLLIGGAALLALLPVMGIRLVPHRDLWPWIIVLGIAVTAFAYGAMAISLGFTGAGIASVLGNSQPLLAVALGVWLFRHGDLGRLSLFFYVVPAVGLGFSWIVYAEPITLQELTGIGLILLGVFAIVSEEWRADGTARQPGTGA